MSSGKSLSLTIFSINFDPMVLNHWVTSIVSIEALPPDSAELKLVGLIVMTLILSLDFTVDIAFPA